MENPGLPVDLAGRDIAGVKQGFALRRPEPQRAQRRNAIEHAHACAQAPGKSHFYLFAPLMHPGLIRS